MKASDLFVKALSNEGVKYVFGVPGEENLDLLESLRQSDIKFVTTRHEQAAGFMAATYGRLTGKAGVCLSTLGPGATNLVTAAAYAQLGGMPLLMITGQKPIRKRKQGYFQIIDTVKMMQPLTKFNKQIVSGESIASLVREAFREAEAERPGAVHLELPEDIASEKVQTNPLPITTSQMPVAKREGIDRAVAMITQAKHPLLLIGAGANRKATSMALNQFVAKTGIPFFNTQMGKGVIDERNPLFLGTAALSEKDYIHCATESADLIINVGHDVIEKPPFIMQTGGTKVIHINFSMAQINDIYFPQHEVVGDVAITLKKINKRITKQNHWDFSYFMKVKEQINEHISAYFNDNKYPLTPQKIVWATRAALAEDDILALDNGMYKIWFARHYPAYRPNSLLLDNALASMGAGLPSAMAAKLVFPHKKVVAVCGDGGFMMNSQELETAIRLNLDLLIIILNDNAYGMIKWKQTKLGLKNFGLEFANPDFVKYAGSYGLKAHKLQPNEELKNVLKIAINKKGIYLLEVPIDYMENEKLNINVCNF